MNYLNVKLYNTDIYLLCLIRLSFSKIKRKKERKPDRIFLLLSFLAISQTEQKVETQTVKSLTLAHQISRLRRFSSRIDVILSTVSS